jgi:hypothetical protein
MEHDLEVVPESSPGSWRGERRKVTRADESPLPMVYTFRIKFILLCH